MGQQVAPPYRMPALGPQQVGKPVLGERRAAQRARGAFPYGGGPAVARRRAGGPDLCRRQLVGALFGHDLLLPCRLGVTDRGRSGSGTHASTGPSIDATWREAGRMRKRRPDLGGAVEPLTAKRPPLRASGSTPSRR